MIRKSEIGPFGLEVSAQGLGCMSLTGFYGRQFEPQLATRTIRAALDLGITLLDTSDLYGGGVFGLNEEFVGRAIRGRRDSVILATKFGMTNPSTQSDGRKFNGEPAYVKSACDASLRRLGVDHIDLYFCHRLDPAVAVEETVGAMAELVSAGKVRYLGLCAVSAHSLRAALTVHPITALESEWSLFTRDIEREVVPAAREHSVAIVPYSPLGRGVLSGQVRAYDDLTSGDYRRSLPRFQPGNLEHNLELVAELEQMAAAKNCTPAQIALAWLHGQGPDVIPIPGADRPEFVAENVAALDLEMTEKDFAAIEAVFPPGAAFGARYSDMTSIGDAVTN